jgi:hypothetical protein
MNCIVDATAVAARSASNKTLAQGIVAYHKAGRGEREHHVPCLLGARKSGLESAENRDQPSSFLIVVEQWPSETGSLTQAKL